MVTNKSWDHEEEKVKLTAFGTTSVFFKGGKAPIRGLRFLSKFKTLLDGEVLNYTYLLLNEQSLSYDRSCDLACFPYQGS